MMNKRVYLDYAATAPLLPEVRDTLQTCYASDLANAATLYQEGRAARQALEQARGELAGFMGCAPQELFFCSGGTEAADTLIEGIARGAQEKSGSSRSKKHLLCAAFEHHAVLDSVLALKRLGFEVELIRPQRSGFVAPETLAAAVREDTLLVTVMQAQNEIGTVQDLAALSRIAHEAGALFMSDCVQGFGKLPFNLAELNIDAACFSAHKLGGPFGVGAFYLKPSVPFLPRQLGGGQERGFRSGTQDVPGALGFAKAAQVSYEALAAGEAERQADLRDALLQTLTSGSERIRATIALEPGNVTQHVAGVLPLLVEGIESQTMVLKLDELGFAVSDGSACSSSSLEPSHVLTSLGISKDEAYGALRISLGKGTVQEDLERFGEALLSLL